MTLNFEALQIKVSMKSLKIYIEKKEDSFALLGSRSILLFLKAMIPVPSEVHDDFTPEIINSIRHSTQWIIYSINHKDYKAANSLCDEILKILNDLINGDKHVFEDQLDDSISNKPKSKPLINVLKNGDWEVNN
jgi:hypothetical protein